jgi:hypothetical protein
MPITVMFRFENDAVPPAVMYWRVNVLVPAVRPVNTYWSECLFAVEFVEYVPCPDEAATVLAPETAIPML